MILASVTVYQRQDGTILDMLRTVVDQVDLVCILLAHGQVYDPVEERAICGEKLRIGYVRPNRTSQDTAIARNEAIAFAGSLGADWVLMVDPDERMQWREGQDHREVLAGGCESFIIKAAEGIYSKDKFMRPGTGEYRALAHEAWVPYRPHLRAQWVPGPKFSELPKDPAALRRRDVGVIKVLRRALRTEPRNPRTHYYLAESYVSLNRFAKAEHHYRECISLTNWGEEAGWSNYKLAMIQMTRGENDIALHSCAMALCCNPGLAEAAWLAGVIRATQGRGQDAIAWSSMAIANGCAEGIQDELPRMHFRDPKALWEAPYETLRAVYHAMGHPERARVCVDRFRDAYQRRLAEDGGPELGPDAWQLTGYEPPEPVPDTERAPTIEPGPTALSMECQERAAE